ncbi:PH domain-containing protein [Alkalicoccus urumqiensis]|uniref:YdbS-like PH domain-containing protein n=1 Tax=Alkalicoccus urumqiensis TaxID=1548213 RepID=A0A2P6MKS7_ALKUR|nr:PH domain-containing protein [Alkalicoccus urumqiensis]PRO66863.1 hypothetical protein C6I21_02770 [Alkalicoccus urumqiensis]
MRPLPDHSLAPELLRVWRISSLGSTLFLCIFPLGYFGASLLWDLPLWIMYILIGGVVLLGLFDIIFMQRWKWKRWKYAVYEDEVELLRGVIIRERVIIPMIRVQHVDTRQGPLLRHYGLASVTISTAATIHEIPGLKEADADELRDSIARLAREADPDE